MGFFSDLLALLFGWSLPERASTNAYLMDDVYNATMLLSFVGFFGLMAVMVYFVVRYHRSQNDKSAYIPHHALAETLWTIIPAVIFVSIAVWGVWAYFENEVYPEDAMVVKVTGKQWLWEYTYEKDGKQFSTINTMYLPMGKPVVFDMTSTDVIHSVFIPSIRAKRDTVPGMRTRISFTPNKEGDYAIYCAEYCGTSHSAMRGVMKVVEPARFERWMDRQIKEANISDPVELGLRLFNRKGCATCHSVSGDELIGPPLNGIIGTTSVFTDGTEALVDLEYIRESLFNPNAKIVQGYLPRMNSFAGQLTEEEVDHLFEYLKSLK